MTPPAVLLAMPTYNGAEHLPEAIESLLAQRDHDFGLLVLDDGSTDGTLKLAADYASQDARVTVERNDKRLGMVRNWRRAFTRCRELYGDAPYFAWVSDHDVWHPRWLAVLRDLLDAHPEAVCAYPRSVGIADDGTIIREPFQFDTAGITDPWRRMAVAHHRMAAGFMVYGLFRATQLEQCGVYRRVLLPDRLLLSQLAFLGELHQAHEILWHRRFPLGVKPSYARQRAAFFPEGSPLHSYLPWWMTHTGLLVSSWSIRGDARPEVSRALALRVAGVYLPLAVTFEARRRIGRGRHRLRKLRASMRPRPASGFVRRGKIALWAARGSWRLLQARGAGTWSGARPRSKTSAGTRPHAGKVPALR